MERSVLVERRVERPVDRHRPVLPSASEEPPLERELAAPRVPLEHVGHADACLDLPLCEPHDVPPATSVYVHAAVTASATNTAPIVSLPSIVVLPVVGRPGRLRVPDLGRAKPQLLRRLAERGAIRLAVRAFEN